MPVWRCMGMAANDSSIQQTPLNLRNASQPSNHVGFDNADLGPDWIKYMMIRQWLQQSDLRCGKHNKHRFDLSENENGGHWQIGIVTEAWQTQIAGHWQNDNTRFEQQRSDTFFDLYNSQICMARRCGRPRFEHFPMMMHNRTPTNHRLYHHYARFLMVVINFVRPCPTLWGAHILLFQFLGR